MSVPPGFNDFLANDHAKKTVLANDPWIHPSQRTQVTGLNCDLS